MRIIYHFEGKDLVSFFQSLLTQDVSNLKSPVYACLLTPQGRFFCDFFITPQPCGWYIEIDKERSNEIIQTLSRYRLRSDVQWTPLDSQLITSAEEIKGGYSDPRHVAMGYRAHSLNVIEDPSYNRRRFSLGLSESELIANKSIPLEYNLDRFNAIDWKKGCYVGQELTARTHYLGVVRKRIFSFKSIEKPTLIVTNDQKEAGKVIAFEHNIGLAMIRVDAIQEPLFNQNGQTIEIFES